MTTEIKRKPLDRFQQARAYGYIDAIGGQSRYHRVLYDDTEERRAYELGFNDGVYLRRVKYGDRV